MGGYKQVLAANDVVLWRNSDNVHQFYEYISTEVMEDFHVNSGIEYKDLDAIFPMLSNVNSILEVGAGSGRVLRFLQQHLPDKKVAAIEQVPAYCDSLNQHFGDYANIIQGDILTYQPHCKFECILQMWAGICDFNIGEQQRLLKKFADLLDEGGFAALESVLKSTESNHSEMVVTGDAEHQIKFGDGLINCYVADANLITKMARRAGFSSVTPLYYYPQGKKRIVYILKK